MSLFCFITAAFLGVWYVYFDPTMRAALAQAVPPDKIGNIFLFVKIECFNSDTISNAPIQIKKLCDNYGGKSAFHCIDFLAFYCKTFRAYQLALICISRAMNKYIN